MVARLLRGLPRRRARILAGMGGALTLPLVIALSLTLAPPAAAPPPKLPVRIDYLPATVTVLQPVRDVPPLPAPAAVEEPERLANPPAAPPPPYLATHRVVSYYGNPLTNLMGILGEYPPEEMIRRLRAQAAVYQSLSPDREVVPAVHMIYAVAQAAAGRDGLYLERMSDALVRTWIDITRENGMLLFLDIQFGRSTIDRELPYVLPYLAEPNVHLALDPEFAWGPSEFPLVDIGHLDGPQVNRAQELLQQFVLERGLPGKILIVHQFRHDMLRRKDEIRDYDGIELVVLMDGFGAPAAKLDTWNAVIRNDNVRLPGFKLFYKHDRDSGGLMSEADVMELLPTPLVIIYQ